MEPITIALPKGRLLERIREFFAALDMRVSFSERRLVCLDSRNGLKFLLVKNSDLPTYVRYGIAGLGICGEDILFESGHQFFTLLEFPFGRTRLCLAGKKGSALTPEERLRGIKVATKYPRFTQSTFNARKVAVELIKLDGSVELAAVLGLAPFIVDLVETGSTLKAHGLEVLEPLKEVGVHLISNPAYYKLRYREIDALVERLKKGVRGGLQKTVS